jgi:hypothetical protein
LNTKQVALITPGVTIKNFNQRKNPADYKKSPLLTQYRYLGAYLSANSFKLVFATVLNIAQIRVKFMKDS